jgi:hypothetical protein
LDSVADGQEQTSWPSRLIVGGRLKELAWFLECGAIEAPELEKAKAAVIIVVQVCMEQLLPIVTKLRERAC